MKAYLWAVLISLDQFANTVLGGHPDETISTRVARNRDKPYWRVVAWFIELIDPGHLDAAEEPEKVR